MRLVLISALCLSLVGGCSLVESVQKFGPYSINVQQGNALDPENVARLKPGLSRSQVRFLLGTPLLVDAFRTDRWDYVYLFYEAGTLTERRRVSLFFEGDALVRAEGDVPAEVAAAFAAAAASPAVAGTPPAVLLPQPAVSPPAAPVDSGQAPATAVPPPAVGDPLPPQPDARP